jgi:ferric-dicitrate binding protein FerR (iron transport regulator)
MNREGSDRPLDGLILGYLEKEATSAEEAEFRRLLADESFCRRVADFAIDLGHLYDQARQGGLDRASSYQPMPVARRRQSAVTILVASASALLLVVGTAWWMNRDGGSQPEVAQQPAPESAPEPADLPVPPPTPAPVPSTSPSRLPPSVSNQRAFVAQVGSVAGQVITRGGPNLQKRSTVANQHKVRSGDMLQTIGPDSFAVLAFRDGSRVVVAGETELTCSMVGSQKRLDVHRGDIMAQVAPQPKKPMVIDTPTAEVEVVGTQLSLFASQIATEVAVLEGHVQLRRFSDDQRIVVRQGECVVASGTSEFVAEPIASVPSVWAEDFEGEWRSRWRAGHQIRNRLPTGSKGGVLAASREEGGPCFISTPNEWSRGLFRIEDDSYLNLTYKLEWPGWFYIMVETRSEDYSGKYAGHYMFQTPGIWRIRRNEWRTISIPLVDFHEPLRGRPEGTTLPPPEVGDVVFSLFLRTQVPDPGLLVDRIWVTQGVPGSSEVLRMGE